MASTTAAGFALVLIKDRKDTFLNQLAGIADGFSEPVRDFSHSRRKALVCFISASTGAITHLARAKRGNKAGTGLRRLNLTEVRELQPTIRIKSVLDRISARSRRSVRARLTAGGLLSEKGFHALVEAIRAVAPNSSEILDQFSEDRRTSINLLPRPLGQALGYQKEALATALQIAGLSRDTLQQWTPETDVSPVSFLEGLPSARLREDPMVINDLTNLPGFDLLRTLRYSAAIFQGNGTHLTVILANRQPLEEQLGTDLIYYNETFQSFVMVQYKAMEHEAAGAVFRLPNEQLAKEIERMESILTEMQACHPNDCLKGFRLDETPFFLKLCPRIVFDPDDAGLVKGMYLPLNYWKLLQKDENTRGGRGGQRVTYGNVLRYFDNSAFVSLVANGWVGTTLAQSAVLASAIRAALETGKAVALAVKKNDRIAAAGAGVADLGLSTFDEFDEN
jgi:hypothetical protein